MVFECFVDCGYFFFIFCVIFGGFFFVSSAKMGRPKKLKVEEESANEADGKEKRGKRDPNWTQEESERLCRLLLQYGVTGILNKTTNGATKKKKNEQWTEIHAYFNSGVRVCDFLSAFPLRYFTHFISFCRMISFVQLIRCILAFVV